MPRLQREYQSPRPPSPEVQGGPDGLSGSVNCLTNLTAANKQASTYLMIHEMTIDELMLLLPTRATTLSIYESTTFPTTYE